MQDRHARPLSILQPLASSAACPRAAPRPRRRLLAPAALAGAALCAGAHAQQAGLPFTETFDSTTFRDEAQTRADWGEREPGLLQLPVASPLTDPFGAASLPEDLLGAYATRALTFADMNGDGRPDLVEGARANSGVYLNNGDGTFTARFRLEGVLNNTRGIAAGDVDRDGDIDVVTGNLGTTPRLYLNAGDGISFAVSDVSPDVRQTDWIVLEDLNGDGFLDAATANHNTTNRIYFNTGDPLLPFGVAGVEGLDLGIGTENTQALAAGDVDNDGDVDLVALNENQVNTLHLNDGAGVFATAPIGVDADNTQAGALGDLNGDGWLDLVAVNSRGQTTKIYFNTGGPDPFAGVTAVELTSLTDVDAARAVALADPDNDGDLDVFLGTAEEIAPAAYGNSLYLNDGTGAFPTRLPIGSELDVTNALAVADVDGDGDLDVVAGNETRDALGEAAPAINRLYRNNGTATGGEPVLQLRGVATSLRVDAEAAPIASVVLASLPDAFGAHNRVRFWVSSNGGLNWLQAVPGRAVTFPPALQGQDLRWRAVLSSSSPAPEVGAASLALDSVTVSLSAPPPAPAAAGTAGE